jgi:hypothetical protein
MGKVFTKNLNLLSCWQVATFPQWRKSHIRCTFRIDFLQHVAKLEKFDKLNQVLFNIQLSYL